METDTSWVKVGVRVIPLAWVSWLRDVVGAEQTISEIGDRYVFLQPCNYYWPKEALALDM